MVERLQFGLHPYPLVRSCDVDVLDSFIKTTFYKIAFFDFNIHIGYSAIRSELHEYSCGEVHFVCVLNSGDFVH